MAPKKKKPLVVDRDAPLGKYAFPKLRSPGFEVPDEKNTKLEDQIGWALDDHFNDNEEFYPETAKELESILQSKKYDDILTTPRYDVVYRGMAVTKEWAEKVIGKEIRKSAEAEVNFVFEPRQGSSSWTGTYEIAQYFAREKSDEEHCFLAILYAKTYDNPNKFLAGKDGIYRLKEFEKYKKEDECTGLGPIKVYKIRLNLY
jgi:hypothetical protein